MQSPVSLLLKLSRLNISSEKPRSQLGRQLYMYAFHFPLSILLEYLYSTVYFEKVNWFKTAKCYSCLFSLCQHSLFSLQVLITKIKTKS